MSRVVDWVGADFAERAVALVVLIVVALIAGVTLGRSARRLEELPGLLLMVPAAIALRGNIFGALGSRLGTAIHAGTFRLSLRPSTTVGENVLASVVLTFATSVLLAVLAKGAAVAFGVANSIALVDFVVVSLIGGFIASALLLVTVLALTAGSVRFGWDPDNVTAPLVTAVGDVVTVPALLLASSFVSTRGAGPFVTLGSALVIAAVPAMAWLALSAGRLGLRTILRESLPVLMFGIVIDLIAGVTVERQIETFGLFPALLVLLPAFLALAGAIGGTLSSRLGSQLHLGMVVPAPLPEAAARSEIAHALGLALPMFGLCGVLAHVFARWASLPSPGLGWMLAVTLAAGVVAAVLAALVAYYSTIGSERAGLDPDTYGIPLVTSTLDLFGAFTLIVAIEVLGVV